jgi:hypothetical protein
MIGFSEYSCVSDFNVAANTIGPGGHLSFAFTGNTGGTGVGGNSTAPFTSFVLQPGLYQFVFTALATFNPAGQTGQPDLQVIKNNSQGVLFFPLTGLEASTPVTIEQLAVGNGSPLLRVTGQNQTFNFELQIKAPMTSVTFFSPCTLMIVQLQ